MSATTCEIAHASAATTRVIARLHTSSEIRGFLNSWASESDKAINDGQQAAAAFGTTINEADQALLQEAKNLIGTFVVGMGGYTALRTLLEPDAGPWFLTGMAACAAFNFFRLCRALAHEGHLTAHVPYGYNADASPVSRFTPNLTHATVARDLYNETLASGRGTLTRALNAEEDWFVFKALHAAVGKTFGSSDEVTVELSFLNGEAHQLTIYASSKVRSGG